MAKTTPKAKNSAFMKPMQPSEHLAKIVGTEPLPRSEVTKKIWAHIKKHKLQNPKNKREILADDKLQPISRVPISRNSTLQKRCRHDCHPRLGTPGKLCPRNIGESGRAHPLHPGGAEFFF